MLVDFFVMAAILHSDDPFTAARPMASAVFAIATLATPPAPARPNILALAFDDLRPWFLPFQDSSIAAPSFLRLAKGALAFNSTYVQ